MHAAALTVYVLYLSDCRRAYLSAANLSSIRQSQANDCLVQHERRLPPDPQTHPF